MRLMSHYRAKNFKRDHVCRLDDILALALANYLGELRRSAVQGTWLN